MGKQEFIDGLKSALNENVSPSLVMENIKYYEDYIDAQIRQGRFEAEVMESLGEPRLIARTIIDANTVGETGGYQDDGYGRTYQNQENGGHYYGSRPDPRERKSPPAVPVWMRILLVVLVIVLIIGAVFSVLSFLMPVLLPLLIILFLVKLFRDWLN